MARTHGRVDIGIWSNTDFKRLTKDAQRGYVMLLSQPQINNCGVVPYVQNRWVKLAADETDGELEQALNTLVDKRFIVLDEHTDEVLIRTFIRHDRIEKQPNLVKAAKREFGDIVSTRIQRVLLGEYPQLFDEVATEDLREPLPEPLFVEPLAEPLREPPPRASARSHARAPAPSPAPKAGGRGTYETDPPTPPADAAPPAPPPPAFTDKVAQLQADEHPPADDDLTDTELEERGQAQAAAQRRLAAVSHDDDIPLK
jgi:hypothetical protein